MAHIVCITTGLTGILNASFEMVSRLEKAGHTLVCAAPENVREQVMVQGFQYGHLPALTLDPEPRLPAFSGPWRKARRWWYKLVHRKERRRQALESIGEPQIRTKLQAFSADLLIIDIELHEYIFTAASLGIPFVLLSQWFSLWKQPGLPYLLHHTIPGQGSKGHPARIAWDWQQVKWQRRWMFAKKKWMSLGTDRRSTLQRLADKLDFPTQLIRENYWPGPFTYRELPVISMTAWEMEFPHRKRQQLFYVGPMVYTGRKDKTLNEPEEQRLRELLDHARSPGQALIYCSVSSLKSGDRSFLQRVCEAVGKEPDWTLIIGLGGKIDKAALTRLPANVHPFSWIPQLKVLEKADCSINHGGIHTINECIHFQVPMLVYSGKRSDQNGCAARVAYHQLGLSGDKDQDSVEEIHQKIRAVLSTGHFRENMQRLHQHYLAYKAGQQLEQTVDKFLSKRR